MTKEKDPYTIFSSFPPESHVETFCKPGSGEKTCRYLLMEEKFKCAKTSSLRSHIDERVENAEMGAKGDNCGGTLGFIIENQELLKGKPTRQEERPHPTIWEAEFESIVIKNGLTELRTTNEGHLGIAEDYTKIDINREGIKFSGRGLAVFVGELQVSFKK